MVAVAMLMLWGGYSLGAFGWCLFRDYDVTLGQLMSPFHPYSGAWPPGKIPAGQIWPGGTSGSSASTTASTSKAAQAEASASRTATIMRDLDEFLP